MAATTANIQAAILIISRAPRMHPSPGKCNPVVVWGSCLHEGAPREPLGRCCPRVMAKQNFPPGGHLLDHHPATPPCHCRIVGGQKPCRAVLQLNISLCWLFGASLSKLSPGGLFFPYHQQQNCAGQLLFKSKENTLSVAWWKLSHPI